MQETSTEFETTLSEPTLAFKGKGSELFSIQIVNIAFTVLSLGLYYPWAKAKNLQYIFKKIELAGSPFTFHGTGKEMFIGFLKGFGILAALYTILIIGMLTQNPVVIIASFLIYLAGFLVLIPVAIHGMIRYRTSRTSWRGIHMGYRGKLSDMFKVFFKGLVFTMFTFGIYSSWFMVSMRKLVFGNMRFGNAKFSFEGEGSELFMIHVKGLILSAFTLGIYFFWYTRDLISFYIDNILIEQEGKYSRLDSSLSGTEYLKLTLGNLLIMVCTLGLGYAWVVTRTLSFIIENCEIIGEFDPEGLVQTEEEYKNATFEDVADMLNLGIV
jgi:uncharacterized membrane protein YjgN (DUF898 family)